MKISACIFVTLDEPMSDKAQAKQNFRRAISRYLASDQFVMDMDDMDVTDHELGDTVVTQE